MRAVLWLSVFAIGVRALTVSTTGVRPAQPTPAVVPNSYSLHDAASAGDVGAVELLLAAGLSSDTRNDRSSTPLHLACALGHDDVAAVLLGRGASANAPNQDGNTPLHAAVGAGQLPCVQLLLSHGADADATSNAGTKPFRSAVHMGDAAMVDAFVLAGAELDEHTAQAAFWVAVQRLEATADGRHVYVVGSKDHAVAWFSTDKVHGGAVPSYFASRRTPPWSVADRSSESAACWMMSTAREGETTRRTKDGKE